MTNERYDKGVEMLNGISDHAVKRINDLLNDICPDMVRFVIEFPYGDIYSMTTRLMECNEHKSLSELIPSDPKPYG